MDTYSYKSMALKMNPTNYIRASFCLNTFSGKLSREKTFMNCTLLCLSVKESFLHDSLKAGEQQVVQASNVWKFFLRDPISH